MTAESKMNDWLELLNRELDGLELRGQGSRDRLLASRPELMELILNSRNVFDFLTRFSKNDKISMIADYGHVVDFFNAKARRNLIQKAMVAA